MATETADRPIVTRQVRCADDVAAFLALPDCPGPHPVVLLLHERYGLVQHTLDLAMRFARDGYACLAPNLFGRHPEQERLARGEITFQPADPQVAADLNASLAYLRQHEPAVDSSRPVVMGVCQSGRWPLVLAAECADVRACLVFYGGAAAREWEVNDTQPEALDSVIGRIGCPVLGIFGEGDHVIPLDDVRRLRDALERHRKSYDCRVFANMPHGWLNDTMPGRYRPAEAEAAWQIMLEFLQQVEQGAYPADRVRWAFVSDTALDYDPSRNQRLE
jgi:carboxymethylenebutenolidase